MLLMDRFSESGAAYTLLKAYSGKRGVYIKPDAATEQTVKDLVQALVDYEKNPSKITINKVIALLDNLDMTAHKVTSFNETRLSYATDKDLEISDKDDILFFHAKDKDKIKGIGQLSFFWRFGDVVIPGQANTYKNPVKPIILSSLHEGTDGAGFMALSEFSKLKAKVLVINGLHKSSSKLPSPFQIERTITDAPHSPNVLPIPFLEQALRVNFPDFALVVVHGLGRNNPDGTVRQMKLWFINSAPGQFDLTQKSWPALLAIAFAQRDFNFGEVSIKCKFPNSFIVDDKGKKRNITSNTAKYDGSSLFAYIGAAIAEIAGCYSFWAWLKLDKPIWWLVPGILSLALFAYLLTLVESGNAGRAYAAYGGVYIVASLAWLYFAEGVRPTPTDFAGAALCIAGAAIIILGAKSGQAN